MRLDLLRHGAAIAVADVVSGERPLTPEGRAQLERLGRVLRARGWKPQRVWASPLLRARQTAAIVLEAAGLALPISTMQALDPSFGTPQEVLDALDPSGLEDHLLLVGHQPLLGQLASELCGSETPFAPGAMAMMECGAHPGPGLCRRIGLLVPGVDS